MAATRNRDGLWGAAVNLVRYAHEVPDLLKVGDRIAYHLGGRPLSTMVQRVYDGVFAPVFQGAGGASHFRVSWSMNESESWFGPLGFLVVLPAAVWSLWRGPGALRGLALVLLAYVFLVAWQVAWTPWNGRFFTLCFACSGGFVACWLERWHRLAWKMVRGDKQVFRGLAPAGAAARDLGGRPAVRRLRLQRNQAALSPGRSGGSFPARVSIRQRRVQD